MSPIKIIANALLFAALAAAPASAAEIARPDKVSFYFAAHADDWQLFMNPSAFEDVVGGASKTVFIHTTAGDAGLGIGAGGRKHPFYLARENGAESAMRFMANVDSIPAEPAVSLMPFNGHPVYRVAYRNTVGYFLRLPDGDGSGSGYAHTGFQSLERLADGRIDSISAVDRSTVYRGWGDLVATLNAIMRYERAGAALIQVNVAELDARVNPGDHSDHRMTAKAALEAAGDLGCVRRAHYVDYASSGLPANLNAQQRDRESAVFAVTLAGVLAMDHGVSWHKYDMSYVGRNYFRVEEPAESCRPGTEVASAARRVNAEATPVR
jgi:hypothetical protein